MASQIRRETVLANFRPSVTERERERRTRKSSAEKREGNSEKHLDFIRKLPCCVCHAHPPSDPHHLKGGPAAGPGERCMFRRSTDQWAVPVCRVHHEFVQPVRGQSEAALFRELGISDVYSLALALFKSTKDTTRGRQIIRANRGRIVPRE